MELTLTLKRAWLIIILALALLAGLIGMAVSAAAAPGHAASMHSPHQIAYYCPPPPFNCF